MTHSIRTTLVLGACLICWPWHSASPAARARLSPQSRHDVCETCGHYVQREDPKRGIAAIRDVLRQAREGS